jgi:hypothetical protein
MAKLFTFLLLILLTPLAHAGDYGDMFEVD